MIRTGGIQEGRLLLQRKLRENQIIQEVLNPEKPLLSGWSYILFNVFVDVIVIHAKSRDCQRIWSPSLRYTSRMIQGLLYII